MTLREALHAAEARLAAAGVPSPRVDAEWLLAHVLGTPRSELALRGGSDLPAGAEASLDVLLDRRARREPLAYVLGEWGFRRLTLKTDRRALVPRPETEALVDRCLARLAGIAKPRVLDVGVGTGAIALAIVDEHPGARVTGIDAAPDTLELARENAERNGLAVELVLHDFRDGLPGAEWDLVVSNPPYVGRDEIEELEPEVRDWEPRHALLGDGLHEEIARLASPVLRPGGWVVLEVGDGQAAGVAAGLRALGYTDVTISRDLAVRERIVEGRR